MSDRVVFDHVAVAVEEHRLALPRYAGDLAGTWVSGGLGPGFAPAQIRFANGMKVELLKPYRIEDNDFLRRFLDRNGPGPHHFTFKVPSLDAVLDRLQQRGYQAVGVDKRDPDWKEAFVHPRQVPGIVVQLAEVSGQEWSSPQPSGWPSARTSGAATLDRVVHTVADLAQGLQLFRLVLEGEVVESGEDEAARWVELRWEGAGRLRLMAPSTPTSPVALWLGGLQGRVHHLAFTCERPGEVAGATPTADGAYEVRPEDNLGVRLVLREGGS